MLRKRPNVCLREDTFGPVPIANIEMRITLEEMIESVSLGLSKYNLNL
ncbi:hypothetical protein Dacet_2633 [Denitrovibrio acetiphilus DSM 12809]|uniref:Uncharacterized protein n=1 Tax=Denitrovibrio acetiphilus (strain DSM 12809 / NBRC 114555 / N2460) TaxID=522772 RepID=D4H535_DENA2|nr:hypothetical protein Dacet_2633 [Denitrovibrio acetiphilus DSM 12809]